MTIFSRFLRFRPKTAAKLIFFHKNQQNSIILTNILYKNTYLLWFIQLNCSNVHFSVFANLSYRPKCSIRFQFIFNERKKFAKITNPDPANFPFSQINFKLLSPTHLQEVCPSPSLFAIFGDLKLKNKKFEEKFFVFTSIDRRTPFLAVTTYAEEIKFPCPQ